MTTNGNGWKLWVIGILGSLVLLGGAGTIGWLVSKVGGFDDLAARRGERITKIEADVAALQREVAGRGERIARMEVTLESMAKKRGDR